MNNGLFLQIDLNWSSLVLVFLLVEYYLNGVRLLHYVPHIRIILYYVYIMEGLPVPTLSIRIIPIDSNQIVFIQLSKNKKNK